LKAEDIIGLKIQAYKNDPSRELAGQGRYSETIAETTKLRNGNLFKNTPILFHEWPVIQSLARQIKHE
jgi:hypothetical protein